MQRWIWTVMAVGVLLRTALHLVFGDIYFDADQAIVGIMGRDLLEGRAFPWTFYGQKYLLAVEAWAAAGSFALFGVSLASLKAPLLLVNLGTVGLLVRLLQKDAGLTTGQAALAAASLVVPSVVTNAYLMAAQGGTVWPLLYVLVLWLLRRRPIAQGLFLGVAYFHREFVLFGFMALLCLDALRLTGETGGRVLERRGGSLVLAFVVYHALVGLGSLNPQFFGPGAPPMGASSLAGILDNARYLVETLIPVVLGFSTAPVAGFGLQSTLSGAPAATGGLLGGLVFLALILVSVAAWRERARLITRATLAFPLYLLLVAAGQAASYVLFIPVSEPAFVRYLVMLPFAVTGLVALALTLSGKGLPQFSRGVALVMATALLALNLLGHLRLAVEYGTNRPENPHRLLAAYLLDTPYRYGWAPYWDAYYLSFITQEALTVAASDHTRVQRYREAVRAQGAQAFALGPPGSCKDPGAPQVGRWQICPLAQFSGDILALTQGR